MSSTKPSSFQDNTTMNHTNHTLIQHAEMIGNLFEEASRRKHISYKRKEFIRFFEATLRKLSRKSLKNHHKNLLAPPNPHSQLIPIVVKLPDISIQKTDSTFIKFLEKYQELKKMKHNKTPFKKSTTPTRKTPCFRKRE